MLVLLAETRHEELGQQPCIAFTVAERRQVDGEQIEPVQQVVPVLAARCHRGQIGVRGRNDADIGMPRAAAANRPVLLILQKPQQGDLRSRAECIHFVEEQSAAARLGYDALACFLRVGKRAAGVTEQLAFDERFRNRAAVDRHERRRLAAAEVMNRARGEFLAGARLALNEHGGVTLRHAVDQ